MAWRHIAPGDVSVREVFDYLLGGIGPRPIALVSTVSAEGIVNLSPFSFYNAFGANPPVIGFSPSRRLRDNTTKDTYHNLKATRECVVQAVTYAMVQQVSLASTQYPPDVNEFDKSGLTPVPSDLVAPPRVKESPFQMECRVREIIELGGAAASGNLVLCEVLKFHIAEDILEDGIIHPNRIDLVARLGADFYCRASGAAVFVVRKPVGHTGIGYDRLPEAVRLSRILTANHLAQLANCTTIPPADEAARFAGSLTIGEETTEAFARYERLGEYRRMFAAAIALQRQGDPHAPEYFHRVARVALDHDDTEVAWYALTIPAAQS